MEYFEFKYKSEYPGYWAESILEAKVMQQIELKGTKFTSIEYTSNNYQGIDGNITREYKVTNPETNRLVAELKSEYQFEKFVKLLEEIENNGK